MTYYTQKQQKRLMVAAHGLPPAAESAFSQRLTASGCLWWHWIPGVWLIVDAANRWTTTNVRDVLLQHAPGASVIALELNDAGQWSASTSQEGLQWLYSIWT